MGTRGTTRPGRKAALFACVMSKVVCQLCRGGLRRRCRSYHPLFLPDLHTGVFSLIGRHSRGALPCANWRVSVQTNHCLPGSAPWNGQATLHLQTRHGNALDHVARTEEIGDHQRHYRDDGSGDQIVIRLPVQAL